MTGDYFHAIRDTTQAISLNPSDVEAYLYRAEAFLKSNEQAHAEDDLNNARRIITALTPGIRPAYAAFCDKLDGEINVLRGRQEFNARHWDQAIAILKPIVDAASSKPADLTPLLMQAYQQRAVGTWQPP